MVTTFKDALKWFDNTKFSENGHCDFTIEEVENAYTKEYNEEL